MDTFVSSDRTGCSHLCFGRYGQNSISRSTCKEILPERSTGTDSRSIAKKNYRIENNLQLNVSIGIGENGPAHFDGGANLMKTIWARIKKNIFSVKKMATVTTEFAMGAILVGIIALLLISYVLKISYNYAIVDGMSVDPETGQPRLLPINFFHSMVLYVLLALFIAPTVIVSK